MSKYTRVAPQVNEARRTVAALWLKAAQALESSHDSAWDAKLSEREEFRAAVDASAYRLASRALLRRCRDGGRGAIVGRVAFVGPGLQYVGCPAGEPEVVALRARLLAAGWREVTT